MDERRKSRRNIKPFSDGDRYGVWKFRIKAYLKELGVLEVLENEAPDPITLEWTAKENIAKGVLIEYLSDSLLSLVSDEKTTKVVIETMDQIYERESVQSQMAIQKCLQQFKWNETTPLKQHFIEFEELFAESNACGYTMKLPEQITRLFLSLPAKYEPLTTALETIMDSDKLTLAFIKSRLLDYEIKVKRDELIEPKVLQVQEPSTSAANQQKPNNKGKNKWYHHL